MSTAVGRELQVVYEHDGDTKTDAIPPERVRNAETKELAADDPRTPTSGHPSPLPTNFLTTEGAPNPLTPLPPI